VANCALFGSTLVSVGGWGGSLVNIGVDERYDGDYAVQVLFAKGREPMGCGEWRQATGQCGVAFVIDGHTRGGHEHEGAAVTAAGTI